MDTWIAHLHAMVEPGLGAILLGLAFKVARLYAKRIEDERLQRFVLQLVKAAEQIYGPGTGAAKLQYVEQQAKRAGVANVSRDAIEAAVYDLSSSHQASIASG